MHSDNLIYGMFPVSFILQAKSRLCLRIKAHWNQILPNRMKEKYLWFSAFPATSITIFFSVFVSLKVTNQLLVSYYLNVRLSVLACMHVCQGLLKERSRMFLNTPDLSRSFQNILKCSVKTPRTNQRTRPSTTPRTSPRTTQGNS